MDTLKCGYIKVAIHGQIEHDQTPKVRPDVKPIEGFEIESNKSIEGDSLSHEVLWTEGKIGSLAEKKIYIRVTMKNTELYSFRFAE